MCKICITVCFSAGELELRYVPACHLWLGTVAEFPKLAENERISPHLAGNGLGNVLLLTRSISVCAGEHDVDGRKEEDRQEEREKKDVLGESRSERELVNQSVWVSETDSESEAREQPRAECLPGLRQLHVSTHTPPSLLTSRREGSLLQPAALPLEAEITNEPAQLTPSEPKRTTTLPLETKVTGPLGLQQDTTLPKETNRTTAVPAVTQETYKPLTLPQETKRTTEPPRLPQETKRTTEPPRLPQETEKTTDIVLSEATKTKETESDVVMIVSSEEAEGKTGDNEQRKEANESDSGLNTTSESLFLHSERSVDLDSEEVPMIVCATVGGVVGGECGEGRDGEVEERERGKGEEEGDKEEKGEEEVGSDEGIGMEEVCVGSETGEGGSVIVVIGSEDDEERYQGVSGMEQNPVIHCCGMELSQSDLRTLEPNKCLNDQVCKYCQIVVSFLRTDVRCRAMSVSCWWCLQVVNCYMKLLVKQAVRKPDTVAIASTFFYTKLCCGGLNGVTRWMKNVI